MVLNVGPLGNQTKPRYQHWYIMPVLCQRALLHEIRVMMRQLQYLFGCCMLKGFLWMGSFLAGKGLKAGGLDVAWLIALWMALEGSLS